MQRRLTIVTGGTRGIGAATAARLARDGHDLVLGYARDDDAADETARRVEEAGVRCLTVAADVTTDEGITTLFGAAAGLGQVTGLVNNAGATFLIAPLADTPVDVIRRSVDLNLTAALLCAREAARVMSRSRGGAGGVIVNVSSGAATIGSPGEYVHYAATKAGIDALTLGLGTELAPDGVRVVGVAPGHIRTRMHADAGEPGRLERVAPLIPMQRPGEPEEVAETIAWLMSEAASYVTGTTLRVAGGR
jgi:glucose 1-dehydrogenase